MGYRLDGRSMGSKPPPPWRQDLRELEARLLSKLVAERDAREREGAELDEELEGMQEEIATLAKEQTRWIRRLRWVERFLLRRPWQRTPRRKA